MSSARTVIPNDLKLRINIGLVILLAGLIFTVGIATAQHLADDQFITQDELQQDIQSLESYAQEGKYIGQYYQNHSAASSYVAAYASQLQKAADSTAQKLDEHSHANVLDSKVSQTIDIADQLSKNLNQLINEPVGQLPNNFSQSFSELSDKLEQLENSL